MLLELYEFAEASPESKLNVASVIRCWTISYEVLGLCVQLR
jgi:hypothetical protein